eukprot:TRINITY_DN73805_c0_g1_i1.p1 TRINITY_DN73805_c0_g1~~TRINITY_DN73805_c0_g1_i1.p1  ORF type:complete len:365 (-),score=51.18 TRINITY_DN73805_c0_g1_i1:145-1239(-)
MGEKRKFSASDGWPEVGGGSKWICFVRHAQALHNVCNDNLWTPDNPLTDEGKKQCADARNEWGIKIFPEADLIVTSPMTRALQTGYLISGSQDDLNWMVTPMCAEKLSGATCDQGRPKPELLKELPWMNSWQGVAELDDEWWTEKRAAEEERVTAFLDFLEKRTEERIVVVSHGAFLEYIVGYHLHNAHHHIMPVSEFRSIKQRLARSSFNLSFALVQEYEDKMLHDLAKAPLCCFSGIGPRKQSLLTSLGPKSVESLANWKFARWAEAICILATTEKDGSRDCSKSPGKININKALDKEWEGWSMSFLLDAPPSAFAGLTQKHDQTFKALGITSIKDLGNWQYYKWARAICSLAEAESIDGIS